MKNIIRKSISILVLILAWYCLSKGISSLLGTVSMLASISASVSLWNVQWFNVIIEPILIVGLVLMLIGIAIWNLQQWRIVGGIVIVIVGIDTVVRALSVLYSPDATSEFFHAPTFIIGYIVVAALSILLGVYFIRNHRRITRST